jgi:hypothetical protein
MQSAVPMQEPGGAGNARSFLFCGKTTLQTFAQSVPNSALNLSELMTRASTR